MPEIEETEETTPPEGEAKQSLEDMLANLDEKARAAVLGQVSKARNEAKTYRMKVRELEPLAAQAQRAAEAQKSAEDRAREAAEAAEKRASSAVARAVRSEVRAHAASSFADPDDVAVFLDLASYVDDDGDIDTKQIEADLADLLQRKPYLGKTAPGERRAPAPDRSQASGANGPAQTGPASEFASLLQRQLGAR